MGKGYILLLRLYILYKGKHSFLTGHCPARADDS